jgi:surfeit locus 1 family protein
VNRQVRWITVLVGALVAVLLTASLGMWQLRRAGEKIALQNAMDAQGAKQPLTDSDLLQAPDPVALVHQRVRLRGQWATKHTVFLDNRQMNAKVGFFVLTPFLIEGGGVVLVQRGWAPRNFENRLQLPPVETFSGTVNIEGRIAPPPSKLFEPGISSTGTLRQNVDVTSFRLEVGLPLMAVTVLQTGNPSEGLRREWPAVNVGVDKHYGYAFQWFALAFLIAALTAWFQFLRPLYQRSVEHQRHV